MMLTRLLTGLALAICMAAPTLAQEEPFPAPQDEVDQLAALIGLTDEQQAEIRELMAEIGPEIQALQAEAEVQQHELQQHVGPDFDEGEIREAAGRLGELTGEMTALSVLLQAKVQAVFTEDQRRHLQALVEEQEEQQRQFQEQLRQQQQQQQQQPPPFE
jgi:periplasmic protein CpxP/Spy